MNNQRGGIISSIFLIPAGVALMVGFFFLGYYVGKYQSRTIEQAGVAAPLPEVANRDSVKQEEFTFYKTLTDKSEKTVSIDLKPKVLKEEIRQEKLSAPEVKAAEPIKQAHAEKQVDTSGAREPAAQKPVPAKAAPLAARKEVAPASKLRYTVQIASYQEKHMADEEVRKLKKRGYAAFIASADVPGKGTWHRVRLGSFTNKTSAESLQKTLHAKEGISPMVTLE